MEWNWIIEYWGNIEYGNDGMEYDRLIERLEVETPSESESEFESEFEFEFES